MNRSKMGKRRKDGLASTATSSSNNATPKFHWIQRHPWVGLVLVPIVTVIIGSGLFGFLLPLIISHAVGDLDSKIDVRSEQKFKDHHFDEIVTSVHKMEALLETLTSNVSLLHSKGLKQAASLSAPDFKRQLPQIDGMLNAAKREKIPIAPGVINDLHDKLVPLLKQKDSEAWQATVSLTSYHSVFNNDPLARFKVKPLTSPLGFAAHYDLGAIPQGESSPELKVPQKTATKESGALYAPIGVDLNPNNIATHQYLKVTGGSVVLDGHHIRNVIFIDVHVVYNGGPLILDAAVFINCRFTVKQSEPGEQFVARSLDSESVTFSAAD